MASVRVNDFVTRHRLERRWDVSPLLRNGGEGASPGSTDEDESGEANASTDADRPARRCDLSIVPLSDADHHALVEGLLTAQADHLVLCTDLRAGGPGGEAEGGAGTGQHTQPTLAAFARLLEGAARPLSSIHVGNCNLDAPSLEVVLNAVAAASAGDDQAGKDASAGDGLDGGGGGTLCGHSATAGRPSGPCADSQPGSTATGLETAAAAAAAVAAAGTADLEPAVIGSGFSSKSESRRRGGSDVIQISGGGGGGGGETASSKPRDARRGKAKRKSRNTARWMQALRNRPLRALWLKLNPLGSAGAGVLASALAPTGPLASLTSLDLFATAMDLEAVSVLMEAVCGSPLKRLYLGGHGEAFGPAGAAVVAAGLADPNCCLVSISCDLNAMGDEGLALLAKALESNTRLRRFCINRNNITGRGIEALCASLEARGGGVLRTLVLGRPENDEIYAERAQVPLDRVAGTENRIGADGTRALAGLVRSHATMTSLFLARSGAGREGAGDLVDAGEVADAVAAADELADALASNTNLSEIQVSRDALAADDVARVQARLDSNRRARGMAKSYPLIGTVRKNHLVNGRRGGGGDGMPSRGRRLAGEDGAAAAALKGKKASSTDGLASSSSGRSTSDEDADAEAERANHHREDEDAEEMTRAQRKTAIRQAVSGRLELAPRIRELKLARKALYRDLEDQRDPDFYEEEEHRRLTERLEEVVVEVKGLQRRVAVFRETERAMRKLLTRQGRVRKASQWRSESSLSTVSTDGDDGEDGDVEDGAGNVEASTTRPSATPLA